MESRAGRLVEKGDPVDGGPTRSLAFQIFTGGFDSKEMGQSFPPPPGDLRETVADLRRRIGVTPAEGRKLGFVLGPLAFDNTDEQVRELIALGFAIATESGVAVGFHVDDSMFWGRLESLNAPENIEWLGWNGPPNTGRRLDWSATPLKIRPQLCVNSAGVKKAVAKRSALIGGEIASGLRKLRTEGKDDLFLGVIAGWETQIGRDFDTGKSLGYHALANAGYSEANPPADLDAARVQIIREFAGFWARSLVGAGVPEGQVYSHIAYMSEAMDRLKRRGDPARSASSYLQTIQFTPPSTEKKDAPKYPTQDLYTLIDPDSATNAYDMHEVIARLIDRSEFDEYRPRLRPAPSSAATRVLAAFPSGIVANQKQHQPQTSQTGEKRTEFGGVIYAESAEKGRPLHHGLQPEPDSADLLHDVNGFMVGRDAEWSGIIRAGAKMVSAVANLYRAEDHGDRRRLLWRGKLCDVRQGLRSAIYLRLAHRKIRRHERRLRRQHAGRDQNPPARTRQQEAD